MTSTASRISRLGSLSSRIKKPILDVSAIHPSFNGRFCHSYFELKPELSSLTHTQTHILFLSLSFFAIKHLPLVATAPVRACSLDILFPPTFTEPCIYRQRCNVVTLFCLGRMRFLQRQQTICFLSLPPLSLSLFLSLQKKATTRTFAIMKLDTIKRGKRKRPGDRCGVVPTQFRRYLPLGKSKFHVRLKFTPVRCVVLCCVVRGVVSRVAYRVSRFRRAELRFSKSWRIARYDRSRKETVSRSLGTVVIPHRQRSAGIALNSRSKHDR